ncbi:protein BANP [Aplysia californica]|uniref:Protein BANP n=1 Tax=Aplysia californica TaxID=6500 RepID=A0ABM0KAZ1_APLCA|nr:protein BANP [Aplysia californica]XP_005113235.1 protein BANP [Aplysia californica]
MSGQEGELVDLGGAGVTIDASSLVSGLATVGDVHVDGATAIIQGMPENCVDPDRKRLRLDSDGDLDLNPEHSFKQILFSINKAICLRLDSMEAKLDMLSSRTKTMEDKVDQLVNWSRTLNGGTGLASTASRKGAVIVGLPQTKAEAGDMNPLDHSISNLGPNVTLITLNTEEDFPNGTWLGDEHNPEMRVRVPITPSDLLHVHSNCRTPEKMALTLLDYLFDRDTQAASNLSGQGKHGKKQLDPLMIYGIRCHLIHRFSITENDWHRIKQNIDSKCRTAWRRRARGMPLTVKAFRGKAPPSYVNIGNHMGDLSGGSDEDSMSQEDGELHIHQQASEADIQAALAMQGEGLQHGEIQILHATPEQISQLQHAQHIQILSGDQVIGQIQPGDMLPEGIQVATMTTDSGEVLQIQQSVPTGAESDSVSQ